MGRMAKPNQGFRMQLTHPLTRVPKPILIPVKVAVAFNAPMSYNTAIIALESATVVKVRSFWDQPKRTTWYS
jgi:hypothetical protein